MEREKVDFYSWVDFYHEFALKLLEYKNNRQELLEIMHNIYNELNGIDFPRIKYKDEDAEDIDPFTLFGFFNKGLTHNNRLRIIEKIKEKFELKSNLPNNFNSLPRLNNMNATYFQFRNERKKDIENLWKFFESVINYLKDPSIENIEEFSKLFNIAINLKNNGTSKITMALYWISPESFLNLDNRSIWFIYESGKIPKEVINKLPKIETKITAETYLTIIAEIKLYLDSENSKLNNFKDLSYDAYIYSEEVNLQIKEDKIKKEDGLAGQNEEVYHERIQNCEINRKA